MSLPRIISLLASATLCCACAGLPALVGGGTAVGPMPIKVGELREDSLEVAVPLVTRPRDSGGWRSPVELRLRTMLTRPVGVRVPVKPNGAVLTLRIRW